MSVLNTIIICAGLGFVLIGSIVLWIEHDN